MTTIRNLILEMDGVPPSEYRHKYEQVIKIANSDYQETSKERKAYRKMLKAMENAERRMEYIHNVDAILGTKEW